MYKVYIETNNGNEINELAELIKIELLKSDNIIVYINDLEVNKSESLNLQMNLYVKLQDEGKLKGPEVIMYELSDISNGLAKEIYKSLNKVYYDKTVNKGVIYSKEKFGLNNMPSVKVNVINKMKIK